MTTPEGAVKAYLKNECEKRGWACLALEYPYKPGWPDRTIFLGGGRTAFIEVKTSGTRHNRKHLDDQRACLAWLQGRGFFADFAIDRSGVDRALLAIRAHYPGWLTLDDI